MLENIETSVTHDGRKLILSVPCDSNIDDWREYLKTILFFLSFHPATIGECFNEESEEDTENTEKT